MLNKKIVYSRHSKRRMQLYNLSEEDVSSIINQMSSEFTDQQGKQEIVSDNIFSDNGLPIKVVFTCEEDKVVVITAYPLKRRANL